VRNLCCRQRQQDPSMCLALGFYYFDSFECFISHKLPNEKNEAVICPWFPFIEQSEYFSQFISLIDSVRC